jgi:hypothetical protein
MEWPAGGLHPQACKHSTLKETEVRLLLSSLTAAALAGSAMVPVAQAAPLAGQSAVEQSADGLAAIEKTQYAWGGQNYCWYPGGWHGPGWYWCGYAWRRGFGWGGGYGWHGWHGGWGGGGWHGGGWHGGGWHGGGWHGGGGGWHGGGFHGGGFHGGGFHGGGHGGHR